jgi:hypothetical protein
MPKYFICLFFLFNLVNLDQCFAQADPDSTGTFETGTGVLSPGLTDTGNITGGSIRNVPQKEIDRWVKNPAFAYANDPAYWKPEPPRPPGPLFRFLNSRLFGWTILFIIVAVVFYGFYLLAKENSFSWVTRKSERTVSENGEPPKNADMDFEFLIRKFQEEGNYRMAVRYMYLRLIQTVMKNQETAIRNSFTNGEIIRALGSHPQALEFRRLFTAYEYIFYGSYIPERELFDLLKIKFENLQQNLSV